MEDSFAGKIITKIIVAIFVVAALDLGFINWWIIKNDKKPGEVIVNNESGQKSDLSTPSATSSPLPSVAANPQAQTVVSNSSPSPFPSSQPVVNQTIVQNANKEIFVPMGSGQTKSGTFADLSGVEVTIDTTKYSAIDYVVFEASIWTDGGNGIGWAQIENVNDNNPLIESQISNPATTAAMKTSGKIPIPTGAKTYRVQAKTSITDYAVHVDNAHLKIVLK